MVAPIGFDVGCGRHFDEYLQQVFPNGIAWRNDGERKTRSLDLWAGRRLKFLPSTASAWQFGTVQSFEETLSQDSEQSGSSSLHIIIKLVDKEGDSEFIDWDLVEVKEHPEPQINGKVTCIRRVEQAKKRCQIQLSADKMKTIKTKYLKQVVTIRRKVCRLNINGGGTLYGTEEDLAPLISFEWLEPVQPKEDVGIPTVTKWVPSFDTDTISQAELERRRTVNLEAFASVLDYGSVDIRSLSKDLRLFDVPCGPRLLLYLQFFGALLLKQAGNLESLYHTFMEHPLLLWNTLPFLKIMQCLPPQVHEVMVYVLQYRRRNGCFQKMWVWIWERYGIPADLDPKVSLTIAAERLPDLFLDIEFSSWMNCLYHALERYFESVGKTREQLAWLERSVSLITTKSSVYLEFPSLVTISKAAELHRQLENYDQAIELLSLGNDVHPSLSSSLETANQVTSLTEYKSYSGREVDSDIRDWVGTSGYMVANNGEIRLRCHQKVMRSVPATSLPDPLFLNRMMMDIVPDMFKLSRFSPKRKPATKLKDSIAFGFSEGGTFASLERNTGLSSLREHSSMASFADPEVGLAYCKIFEGDFDVEWTIDIGGNFVACVLGKHHIDGDVDTMRYRGRLLHLTFSKSRFMSSTNAFDPNVLSVSTQLNERFGTRITEDQRNALAYRVLLLFLRFEAHSLDHEMIFGIGSRLDIQYRAEKWWKGLLECSLVTADLACLLGAPESDIKPMVFNATQRVGEALEANGDFLTAANLYLELADSFFPVPKERPKWFPWLHANSGLAFMRAGDFQAAELQLITTLHLYAERGPGWLNQNETAFHAAFQQLFFLYKRMLAEHSDATAGLILETLCTLLCITGYRHLEPLLSASWVKPELRDKRVAKQALEEALQAPNLTTFRAKLVECSSNKSLWPTKDRSNIPAAKGPSEKSQRMHRYAAREVLGLREQPITRMECGYKECRHQGYNFKLCSRCQAKAYCSKECQTKAWKDHKKLCIPCK